MRKQVLNLILLMVAAAPAVLAQSTVKFNGLGRAVVQNDAFSDTTSVNEGRRTGGHTLMDLGITATRENVIRVNTILRVRNQFGGFFGEGIDYSFRQMRIEGVVGKVVKYEIGDLDVGLTPYTIFNANEIDHQFESRLFGIKRDVVNYENFYTDDNTWRMQGVNLFTTLKFTKGIDKLKLRTFGNRIKSTDFISIPSRFVYGANAIVSKDEYGEIGLNQVTTADITGTVKNSDVDYNNNVFSVNYNLKYDISDKISIGVKGEAGSSSMKMTRALDDSTVSTKGGFYDVGLEAKYKPLKITLGGSIHAVDKNFSSPTAQTLRVGNFGGLAPQIFPTYNGGDVRSLMLFDRYSQDQGLYNQSISTVLMTYNPIYGNVSPYGAATPNRQGISVYAKADSAKFYQVAVGLDLLSEIAPENDTITNNKRSFMALKAGAKLYVNQFIGFEKEISLQGGIRKEQTTREGLKVDLSSSLIDLGIDVEAVSDLHLMLGYKMLSAKGVEYTLVRNEFNQVATETFPVDTKYDQTEGIVAVGLRYDFSNFASFSVQGQFVSFRNDKASVASHEYDMNQVYCNYTVKF